MDKARYCTRFESQQKKSSSTKINGYKIRKDQIEDYRTARQWIDAGFKVKEGSIGKKMYASRYAAMNHGR